MISCSESEFSTSRTPSLSRRYLYVPTTTLSFEAQPSTKKINIESDQTDWTLNIPVNWIKSNQMNGNSSASIDLTTQLNNSADTTRVCVATISSAVNDWNRSFPLTITQNKNNPYIDLGVNSIVCTATMQSATISVNTNTEFSVDNTGSSWLHIESISADEVRFSVDENNTGVERNAYLTLKAKSYPGTTASINIRQKIAHITATENKLTFGHNSSSQSVVVESEVSWTATSTGWISVSPKTGQAGGVTVTISVPNNASTYSRTGSVYFNIADNNNIEIPVEQEGVTLSASQNSISFNSYGGNIPLTITSNDSWQVTSKPEWVNINTMSDNGNATIEVSTIENNTTSSKSGSIVISSKDNVTSVAISVEQVGKHVDYSDVTLTYSYKAGSQDVSFTTDGNWTLTKDAEWISVDKTSGSGSATLKINVEENNQTGSREGLITLLIAGEPFKILVHQNCKYITLSSTGFTFSADPGTTTLTLESNTQWTTKVIDGGDWMSVSPVTGNNNAELTINVLENKTIAPRSGKIEVEIPNVQTYIVDIVQNRRYIKTDMTSIDFLKSGGQISFNVTTDGTYEVSKIGSWFGFVKSGDCITVIAQENTNSESRTGAIVLKMINLEGGGYSVMIPVTQSSN